MRYFNWLKIFKIFFGYIFIIGLAQYFAYLILKIDYQKPLENLSMFQNAVIGIFTGLATFLSVGLFNKYVDGKSFKIFQIKKLNNKHFYIGILIGILIMLLGFITLLSTKQIFIKRIHFNIADFVFGVIFFVCVSFSEELFIRGYVLNSLLNTFNKYSALTISSLMFATMHFANPNLTWFAFFNIFIAGVLLGIVYIYTKNLWFSFGLHFSWNFFQGSVFGFNVSGVKISSIFTQDRIYNNIWNGGNFGFEGSILSIILQIICIVVFYLYFTKHSLFKKLLAFIKMKKFKELLRMKHN